MNHCQDSNHSYKMVIDTLPHGIFMLNEKGAITYCNKSAENLLGYAANEVIGKNISLFLPEYVCKAHNCIATLNKNIDDNREVFCKHKNKTLIPVIISLSDTKLKDDMRFTLVIINVSDIKFIGKTLEQKKQHFKQIYHNKAVFLEKENNHLRRLSEIDHLTEIANRRVYEHRLSQEVMMARRSCQPISLMIIDIDYFKEYNDYYGHTGGDRVLKRLAQTMKKTLPRKTDLIARIGGDEFVVLMPVTDNQGAYRVAENIRSNIEALGIKHHHSDVAKCVTVCIGLTSMQGSKFNSVDLFNQADSALYDAKRKKRNQCIVHTEVNR